MDLHCNKRLCYRITTINYTKHLIMKQITVFTFAIKDKYSKTVIVFLNQLIMLPNATICV